MMFSNKKISSKVSSIIAIALFFQLLMLPGGFAAEAGGDEQTAASAADLQYVISDFETGDDDWEYSFGEQPNIQGAFEIVELEDEYTGGHAGKLSADFSQSSKDKAAYTAMRKDFEALELGKYAFWVKTAELKAVRIRTTDATGQVFQQKINLQDSAEWQQVVVDPITSSQYWGGAANGKWNAPAKKIAIMIDRNDIKDGKLTASMLVDRITADLNIPDLAIKQSVMGNIYLDNELVAFNVSTRFSEVIWQVYNLNGELVRDGIAQIASDGRGIVQLPGLQLGYYTLELSAQSADGTPVRLKTPFALLSDYDWVAVEDSPFGIAAHLHRESFGWSGELARLIRYAGAKTARGGYEWSIEKSLGQYTFTPQPERFMSFVQAEGLKSMFVSGYNHPLYDNNMTPYTDAGREGFANYVNAYIEHFKDQLVGVQVYNEFNGGFGKRGNSPADSKPEYYYKLLKKTYETVKENHSDFIVSGMVSAGIDLEWIEEVLKLGGMNYLDNIAVHPYRYGRAVVKDRAPEGMAVELEQLKQLIREYNDGELKPIWISEFGWPTHQAAIGVDEKTQADFLVRAYVIALSQGVEQIVWYNLMNDGLQADYNEHNFGLVRFKDDPLGAHTPKPSYVAYAAMTRELTNAAFIEEESYGGDIKSFLFERDGEELRAVWAVEDTNAVILTDEPLQITDITGHTEQFVPYNGKIYLTLNGELLYLKGNLDSITSDNTFTVIGEESFIGDETGFTVQLNNEDFDGELKVALAVEGNSYTIAAVKGNSSSERITVSPARDTAFRSSVISIKNGEQTIGRLRHSFNAFEASDVKVKPILSFNEDGSFNQSLELEIVNFGKVKSLLAAAVSWSLGDKSGRQQLNGQIMPGEKRRFNIPLEAVPMGTDLPADVQVDFESGLPFQFNGNLSFNPIMRGDGTVGKEDGEGEDQLLPTIDLAKGKKILQSGHSGSIDVTGHIWLQYDSEYFYLLADVEDDIHAVPASGADIWNNDSIQFAIVPGVPGESKGWYEFGIADTPDGTHVHRWSNLIGKVSEPVQSAKAEVIRDEEQKRTIYKLALPWQELEPIKPERGEVISFSLLVNDNDGNGRHGWVEWASGIGAEKRASLFRSMQWIHTESQPQAHDAAFKTSTDKALTGSLVAEHAEGTVISYELVRDGELGTAQLNEQDGIFLYTPNKGVSGEDSFTFRVHDGFGYSNIAVVTIEIEKNAVVLPGNTYTPGEYKSTNGKLELPAGAAGRLSFQDQIELIFPAGTADQPLIFTIMELDGHIAELPKQTITTLGKIYELAQNKDTELKHPVQVSVKADLEQLGQDEKAVLYAYDAQSGKWKALDTEVKADRLIAQLHELTAIVALIVPADGSTDGTEESEGSKTVQFTDIAGHWAAAAIQEAAQKGLINGLPDGSFKPNREVTRTEFAVMLVRALQLPGETDGKVFADDSLIPGWAKQQVYMAARFGLLQGYSDGSFAGQRPITRAELAVMTDRALKLIAGVRTDKSDAAAGYFADADAIPFWAEAAVKTVRDAGLLQGRGDNRFAPGEKTTRAEAAVLLLRLLKQ
ncbi:S-layer homology domain-containing protein [Paenibacillus sp. GXUN7292]|uniref:S-layer homology domain-containing protein n=1 Tax=Paenibacillus sp. GXUN7292 TaxID=3422499 RepID=UPI003D7CD908